VFTIRISFHPAIGHISREGTERNCFKPYLSRPGKIFRLQLGAPKKRKESSKKEVDFFMASVF